MEWILYISVGLVAIFFCVLVIYIISTLKTLSKTLHNVSETLTSVDQQMKGITKETQELLVKTNALADDIQEKSAKLSSVVEAASEVGTTIRSFNKKLENVSNSISKQVEHNQEKVAQVVQITNIILELKEKWQELKRKKQREKQNMLD